MRIEARWAGMRLAQVVALLFAVAALLAPAAAHASMSGTLGDIDLSYGNQPPAARISGPSGASYDAGAITALPDGRTLVADARSIGVTRLTASGLPDPSYGPGGLAAANDSNVLDNSSADAVAVAANGEYLVAGAVGGDTQLAVAQFTPGYSGSPGALNGAFATNSPDVPGVFVFNNTPARRTPITASSAQGIVVEPDGTIIVAGTEQVSGTDVIVVVRLDSDGNENDYSSMTFQGDNQSTTASAIALGPNGTVYVAGTENGDKAVLARITTNTMELDASFDPTGSTPGVLTTPLGGSSAQLAALSVAGDGDVLIGGQVGGTNAVVARVTSAGSLDPSFGSRGVAVLGTDPQQPAMSFVRGLYAYPDGGCVLAGDSGTGSAPTGSFVAELTSDGQLDPSFDSGGNPAGATFEGPIAGYNAARVAGLAVDDQGRLLMVTTIFSTSASGPNDEGEIQRFTGYSPPTASFTAPAAVVAGRPATFDASSSTDSVGTIADYAWDFTGDGSYTTDAGGAPAIEHTFTATGNVQVSLQVTDLVGQTGTATQTVDVLPPSETGPISFTTPSPHASLSTPSLSFQVNINQFDAPNIDSAPEFAHVTNTGNAPLSISSVGIVNSDGAFIIGAACAPTLGADGTFTGTCVNYSSDDTCQGDTLAPGYSCYVAVQYQDAGQHNPASGALEIDSNSPTSPDLVQLSGTANVESSSGGSGSLRCPGVIGNPDLTLGGCFADISADPPSYPDGEPDTWAAYGAVTLDDQVTLQPTNPQDELIETPDKNIGETISATPANAQYQLLVIPPDGSLTPDQPVGLVSLGSTPFVCKFGANNAPLGAGPQPYGGGCDALMTFSQDHPADTIHGLPVTGGNIIFGNCGTYTSASANLPNKLFGTEPQPSPAPTAGFDFGGCVNPAGNNSPGSGQGSGSDGVNPQTCPGEAAPTPGCNGHPVPPDGPKIVHHRSSRAALAHRPDQAIGHDTGQQSDPCPQGDTDYSETLPVAFVGAMGFQNPYLCYDPTADVWTTGGSIQVADATINTGPPPDDGIGFHSDGTFDHGGIQDVTFPGTGVVLVPPVALKQISGAYAVDPTRLGAKATITAGPVTITGGGFAAWASPAYPFTYDPSSPYSIPGVDQLQTNPKFTDFVAGVGGTVGITAPLIGTVNLANAYALYAAPSYFEFGGNIGINDQGTAQCGSSYGGAWCVGGGVLGALDTGNGEYNIAGGVSACANFPVVGQECVGLQGVVSSGGVGVCGSLGPFDGGFTLAWGQGPDFFGGVGTNCTDGLAPVTVVVQRSGEIDHAVARVAPGSGAVGLNLAGSPPSTSIYVYGTNGAPAVSLAGPGGQQLTEPAGGSGIAAHGIVIWPEPKLDETVILVSHPATGRWTVTPQADSVPISKMSYANMLPPPAISATVSGKGSSRTLAYRVRPRAGQVVTFAERGREVFHVLGKARGANGSLRFEPAPGPGGRRTIIALIKLANGPAPNVVAGAYTAPSPPKAERPSRLRVSRAGTTLRASWAPAANANSYLAVVSLTDGRRISFSEPARTREVSVPDVSPSTGGRIQLLGVTAAGATGPAATAKVTTLPAPGRVTRLRALRVRAGVRVSWNRVRGASLYVVAIAIPGAAYPPQIIASTTFVSKQTLPELKAGKSATITVRTLGPSGEQGKPTTTHYRAPR